MVGGDGGRGIQVLNISNVNAQGKTVLNDGKLLELIQQYPFIYNPRVRSYGDDDYTMWAWKRINAAFNRSYENDPFAAFSISDLMSRWQVLKPLIQCLSKAYDLQAVPSSLRQSVLHINAELEDPRSNCNQKTNTPVQKLLQDNMSEIAKLPLEQRLALEKEVLDLLLNAELDGKQIKKLDAQEKRQANQEADDLLKDIGFNQVFDRAWRQKKIIGGAGGNNNKRPYAKLVPLSEAHKHIRPCYVNVKRMNLEDYLPLAQIKKFYSQRLL
ncbi:lethal hybrid rescue [Musca autumnalis]|uniref:lethal hybrid rescue n=1 Tax=Musca autumnalis TaxID=221902 RepID=UPI003CEB9DA0